LYFGAVDTEGENTLPLSYLYLDSYLLMYFSVSVVKKKWQYRRSTSE